MAARHSIPPFPSDIDRNYFGAWLSGFVDGEGCFQLGFTMRPKSRYQKTAPMRPYAVFSICLRADDAPILNLIRSFFGCGHPVYMCKQTYRKKGSKKYGNKESPTARFAVKDIKSLNNIIVPHFVKYPLLAKKSSDFVIWKEGITFMHRRTATIRTDSRNRKVRGYHSWNSYHLEKFDHYVKSLRSNRLFTTPSIERPLITSEQINKDVEDPLFSLCQDV